MADRRREEGNDWRNTPRYLRLKAAVLAQQPLCVACEKNGLIAAAEELDHISPVAAGGSRWDRRNCQGLCRDCHQKKSVDELRQYLRPNDVPCPHGWTGAAKDECMECAQV